MPLRVALVITQAASSLALRTAPASRLPTFAPTTSTEHKFSIFLYPCYPRNPWLV